MKSVELLGWMDAGALHLILCLQLVDGFCRGLEVQTPLDYFKYVLIG
jgi:hypothetical protein